MVDDQWKRGNRKVDEEQLDALDLALGGVREGVLHQGLIELREHHICGQRNVLRERCEGKKNASDMSGLGGGGSGVGQA